MMTLDQFRATGRDCDDLGKALSDTSMGETGEPIRGRLYAGSLYIIRRPESGWIDGDQREWDLVIANQEWISDDLPDLEARLYEFALSEGYCE